MKIDNRLTIMEINMRLIVIGKMILQLSMVGIIIVESKGELFNQLNPLIKLFWKFTLISKKIHTSSGYFNCKLKKSKFINSSQVK